jgi:hypothetical protein
MPTNKNVSLPLWSQSLQGRLVAPDGARAVLLIPRLVESHIEGKVAEALRARGLATFEVNLYSETEQRIHAQLPQRSLDPVEATVRVMTAAEWLLGEASVAGLPFGYVASGAAAPAVLIAAAAQAAEPRLRAVVAVAGHLSGSFEALRNVRAAVLLIAGGHDYPSLRVNREAHGLLPPTSAIEVLPVTSAQLAGTPDVEEVARLGCSWLIDHLVGQPRHEPRSGERLGLH